jgi:Pyruvate phosphate dikinase, AMP/ATP-binding domain
VEASEVTNTEARRSVKRGESVNRPQSPIAGVPEGSEMQIDNYVRDISTLGIENAKEAGGKGANLGELVAAELPVPPGFVLLRASYQDSMRTSGVSEELAAAHREVLAKVGDSSQLAELCDRMQSLVLKAGIPRARARGRCRSPIVSDGGGWPRRVVRRDERDLYQRHRRRRPDRCGAALLGVAVQPPGYHVSGQPRRLGPSWRRSTEHF